jgi:ankyrin repeat protein
MTSLHWAAYNADVDTVNFLLKNKAELLLNKDGETAIDIAGLC